MYDKLQNTPVGEIVHPNMIGIVKTKTVPFLCRDPGRNSVGGVLFSNPKLTRDMARMQD